MKSIYKSNLNSESIKNKTLSDLQIILPPGTPKHLHTNDLARYMGVRPDSIRRSLCKNGHYAGLVPLKLSNGRLLWPVFDC